MTALLYGIGYSPWTAKARWALDHHAFPYKYREHVLIFGMPELRWRTGRWTGGLTVPALVVRDPQGRREVLMDSWAIARRAEEQGQGTRLFPEAHLAAIERYNALSEQATDAVRTLLMDRLLADRAAKAEVLPHGIPGPLRGALAGMAGMGVSYVRREFNLGPDASARARETLRAAYAELRRELGACGGRYLLGGGLTYADVAMAVALQGLEPHASVRMGPAYRRCWGDPALRDEFADLVAWRDRLYADHRPGRA